jgi:predicted DNA-binding transcriptional regulator YafY
MLNHFESEERMNHSKPGLNQDGDLDEKTGMKKKKPENRNSQVVRILRVIRVLEIYPQGISAEKIHQLLADEHIECDIRTVYRDLAAIQDSHFPVESFKNEEGENRWRFSAVATVSGKIQISYNEIVALYIARECLDPLKGTPIYNDIQVFFDKVAKLLGPNAQKELGSFDKLIGFKAKPTWTTGIKQEIFDCVHSACHEGHVIRLEYRSNSDRSRGQISERRVGPLGILLSDSSIYLIAKDLGDNVIKKFSMVRILTASWTEDSFDNAGFSLGEVFKSDFGMLSLGPVESVTINIREPIASYVVERRWHDSQKVIRREDGSLDLTMVVRVNNELARWVLGLGAEAKVVGPESLKGQVEKIAKDILTHYNGDGTYRTAS